MSKNWWLDTAAETAAKVAGQIIARDQRAARRRDAAWSGFDDEEDSAPTRSLKPATKAAITPAKVATPAQKNSPRAASLQPAHPTATIQYSEIARMEGWVVDGESAGPSRGMDDQGAALKSVLMPLAMKYRRGMYGQPMYEGYEGVRGMAFAEDLLRALLLYFQREPKSDQAKDPVSKAHDAGRAIQETFSTHPRGREWCEKECSPVIQGLLMELPAVIENMAKMTVKLAPEYAAMLEATTSNEEEVSKRVEFWTKQPEFGHMGLAQTSSWLVEGATRTLTSMAGQAASAPQATTVGDIGTPASSNLPGRTSLGRTPLQSARFTSYKQVKEELRLGHLVFLVRDTQTGVIKLFPFKPVERVLLVACSTIKAGPGAVLTEECGRWFQQTTFEKALDGSPITGDSFDHLSKRLHMFLNLKGAEGAGMTKNAIYNKILQAARSLPRLRVSIETWNIQHNKERDPNKLAAEADAQWRQIQSDDIGAEMGAATSASRLTTAKEFARFIKSLAPAQRAEMRKQLAKEAEAEGEKKAEQGRNRGSRGAAVAAVEEEMEGYLADAPATAMVTSQPPTTQQRPKGSGAKAGKVEKSAATTAAVTKLVKELQTQLSSMSVAKQAGTSSSQPSVPVQPTMAQSGPFPHIQCLCCKTFGHKWMQCPNKPPGWTPPGPSGMGAPQQGRGTGPWVPSNAGRGAGVAGRGQGYGGRGSGAPGPGVSAGMGAAAPQAYVANTEASEGMFGGRWAPSPWLEAVDGYHRAMVTVVSSSQEEQGAMGDGTRGSDHGSLGGWQHSSAASPATSASLGTPAGGATVFGPDDEGLWNVLEVLSETHVDSARKAAATPLAELQSVQGSAWIRQQLSDLAMCSGQHLARRWGFSTTPKAIALEVAYKLGLKEAPAAHVIVDMLYPAALALACLYAMVQWCDRAQLAWSRELGKSVVKDWLAAYDGLTITEEVALLGQHQPTSPRTHALKEEWQAPASVVERCALQGTQVMPLIGSGAVEQAPAEFPAQMLHWTPETVQLAMSTLCEGPDPVGAGCAALQGLLLTLDDKDDRAAGLNAMLGREPGSVVPDLVRYDKELVEWRNPLDVVPPTVPGLLAKSICIVGEFWPGLQVVLEWLVLAAHSSEDEAMQWLSNSIGLCPLRLRGRGWSWTTITAAQIRQAGDDVGQLDMVHLATLPQVGVELLGVGGILDGAESLSSGDEEAELRAYVTVAAAEAAQLPPSCQCAQPAVLEEQTWVCAEGECAFVQPSSVEVPQPQQPSSELPLSMVTAHQVLPRSFQPAQQVERRPGTVLGRLPGTEPVPAVQGLLVASQRMRKLDSQALAKRLSPDELHAFLGGANGTLYVGELEGAAEQANSAVGLQPAASQHAPLSLVKLTPQQLEQYRAAVPTVFFLANESAAEGMLLRHNGIELLNKRLMMDDGADCVVMAQKLAEELGLGWRASNRGVHTSCAGVQQTMGLVTTPFQLVVAAGTQYERVIELGGARAPVFVSKEGSLFHMLVDQNIRHQLAGFVDPFTTRFHYRPHLWTEGDGQTWHSLRGYMYRECKPPPSASGVIRAGAEVQGVALVSVQAAPQLDEVCEAQAEVVGLSCAGESDAYPPGAGDEYDEEVLLLSMEKAFESYAGDGTHYVLWSCEEPLRLAELALQQVPSGGAKELRRLALLHQWAEALQADHGCHSELPDYVQGAGLWLLLQWLQYVETDPVAAQQPTWGFPALVDARQPGLRQQCTLIQFLPALESMLHSERTEPEGLDAELHARKQLLLETLQHATSGAYRQLEEQLTAELGNTSVQVEESAGGSEGQMGWSWGSLDSVFWEGLEQVTEQLSLADRVHLQAVHDFAVMAAQDGMGACWVADLQAVAAAEVLRASWQKSCEAPPLQQGVGPGFPLLPPAAAAAVHQPLLTPLQGWLAQILACEPYADKHNQHMRESLLAWLSEATMLVLAAASPPSSATSPCIPQSSAAAVRKTYRRLGPGPKLPPRYRAAGGAASRRKGRRLAAASGLPASFGVQRPQGLGGVWQAGRRRKVIVAGWRRRLARLIRRARISPRVAWPAKLLNATACHAGAPSSPAGEPAAACESPPWLGGDPLPAAGSVSYAVEACTAAVAGTPEAAELPADVARSSVPVLQLAPDPPAPAVAAPKLDEALQEGARVMQQLQGATCGYLRATMPEGEADILLHPGYTKDEENLWVWGNHPDFTPAQLETFKAKMVERKGCFAYSLADLQGYAGPLGDFQIPLEHDQPIRQKPRRMSQKEVEIVDAKCKELLEAGFIVPCPSTLYGQNVVVAAKKDADGNWTDYRFCIDYRPINKVTPADKYPLHLADDLWDRIGSKKFLTKIDMRSGFHNIRVAEADQPKTAFWWGNRLYMWRRAPFGLKCIANFFQRVMDNILRVAGLEHCCTCFIDDLLVFSDTAEEHIQHVCAVLDAVAKVGLRAHPSKSILGAPVVEYLGHNVSVYGVAPTEAKVAAIKAIKAPTNVGQLRAVLGLLSYYRCYVPQFGAIASPLTDLTKAKVLWTWIDTVHGAALRQLIDLICTPGRVLRRADPRRPFILHTDWSKTGIGAVLGQLDDDGQEYLVACISRSLNQHERNYSSPQGEMLAAVWGVKSFRHYLRFTHFTLSTDHQALQWLVSTKELSGQYARWALILQEFDFTVVHRPGTSHQNADAVSRMPLPTMHDSTGARLDVEPIPRAACLAALGGGGLSMASHIHTAVVTALADLDDPPVPWTVSDVLHLPAPSTDFFHPADEDQEALTQASMQAVHDCLASLQAMYTPEPLLLKVHRGGPRGGIVCDQLCTVLVSQPFFAAAYGQGITLYEPFGGLGAGVEMALRCGWKICQYLYSDIDPHARAVIRMRLEQLHERFPQLLPVAAYQQVFRLPQDVYQVTSEHLLQVGAGNGGQWLVVAGWECQDMSPAGTGRGLQGPRSKSFFPLLNLLASLQLLQQQRPPGYLIENTAFQFHHHDKVAVDDFQHICGMLHQPVVLDAAQFGSYAHRVRNFWTNLADSAQLQRVMREVKRPADRLVTDILPSHVLPLPVRFDDTPPRYRCNKVGHPMQALPCLVAHGCSRAFRDLGAGVLYNTLTQQYEQPSVVVRELALGYPAGCTAAPGVPEQARHAITGRAMDAFCMQFLGATCAALAQAGFGTPSPQILAAAPPALVTPLGSGVTPAESGRHTIEPEPLQASAGVREGCVHQQWAEFHDEGSADPGFQLLLSFACLAAVAAAMEADQVDIWADEPTLAYLRTGQLPLDLQARRRVVRRAKQYSWQSGVLKRVMQDGTSRVIPKLDERDDVIRQVHEQSGHFGRRRTTYLLFGNWWWQGLAADVARVVRNCAACDRVKAAFTHRHPVLHPLPIMGLMYRWGVDLAGPLRVTARGNQYVMVMIEHFSKWIELVALPAKTSQHTAEAFLDRVLCRYGAPAEVVTDRGTEFEGQFAELLQRCMVDHRTTSPAHPQADGLAERAVQTVKKALRKISAERGGVPDWDIEMHWVALGYRCSVQESTGFSPYLLLYGVQPIVPPAVKEKLAPGVDFDQPERAADQLRARAVALKRMCAAAGHNLVIAQHRDTLRYAKVRSGGYVPKLFKFQVGDYVYLRQGTDEYTLDARARPLILRVKRVTGDGSLQLLGQDGVVITVHGDQCAPCHLTVVDGRIDHKRSIPSIHTPCEVCGLPDRGEVMLLCDECNKGWHTFCLDPPLEEVPAGEFKCPMCLGEWKEQQLVHAPQVGRGRRGLRAAPVLSAAQRAEVAACEKLHGRVRVVQSLDDKGQPVTDYGQLRFLGEGALPRCLEVVYGNGSKQRLTSAGAQRGLMHGEFQQPAEVSHSTAQHQLRAAAAAEWVDPTEAWPDQWVTHDGKDMQQVLKRLQPGPWVLATCTRMHNSRPGTAAYVERVQQVRGASSPLGKIRLLAKVINHRLASNLVDPWSDMLPEAAGQWAEAGWHVLRNTAREGTGNELAGDTTHPGWYRKVAAEHGLGVIVGFPWTRLLDLVLPMAAAFAAEAVMVDVPVTWVANAPPARAEWLDALRADHRLLMVMGSSSQVTQSGVGSCWLCVFRDRWRKARLLRAAYQDVGDVCWVK